MIIVSERIHVDHAWLPRTNVPRVLPGLRDQSCLRTGKMFTSNRLSLSFFPDISVLWLTRWRKRNKPDDILRLQNRLYRDKLYCASINRWLEQEAWNVVTTSYISSLRKCSGENVHSCKSNANWYRHSRTALVTRPTSSLTCSIFWWRGRPSPCIVW